MIVGPVSSKALAPPTRQMATRGRLADVGDDGAGGDDAEFDVGDIDVTVDDDVDIAAKGGGANDLEFDAGCDDECGDDGEGFWRNLCK